MGNRCLNDMFNYCTGEPKVGKDSATSIIGLGNGCTKDPATCGNFFKEEMKQPETKESRKRSKNENQK